MTAPRRTANRHPELAGEIRAVITAYAVRSTIGRIIVCLPTAVELAYNRGVPNRAWVGHTGKVCYPDAAGAQAAAYLINAIPGADAVVPYECPRGDHFHHVARARQQVRWEAEVGRMWAAVQRSKTGGAVQVAG